MGRSLRGDCRERRAADSFRFSCPSASLPGPSYKWVRINAITELALNVDVDGNGVIDRLGAPIVMDPANVDGSTGKPVPGLVVSNPSSPPVAPTGTAVQALEITALAVAPNGGKRLLQYVVAPLIISPDAADQNFPAALTLDGNGVTYQAPGTPGLCQWSGLVQSPTASGASGLGPLHWSNECVGLQGPSCGGELTAG